MAEKGYTISQFNKAYPTEAACLQRIFNVRFGDLEECPSCSKPASFHRVKSRPCYACAHCGFQVHPLAGTVFHKTHMPLKSWFFVLYMFSVSKNGVSAKEIERALGCTYQTAWRMARQVRSLFDEAVGPLTGTVEMDEAYFGGHRKGITGRGGKNKAVVVGMVERKGRAVARHVDDATYWTLSKEAEKAVSKEAVLMTDDYTVYRKFPILGYDHRVINHRKGKYVRGDVHTNTVESLWSQMKRSIDGTHHAVSQKWLQSYVNEHLWKRNRRGASVFSELLDVALRPGL